MWRARLGDWAVQVGVVLITLVFGWLLVGNWLWLVYYALEGLAALLYWALTHFPPPYSRGTP